MARIGLPPDEGRGEHAAHVAFDVQNKLRFLFFFRGPRDLDACWGWYPFFKNHEKHQSYKL